MTTVVIRSWRQMVIDADPDYLRETSRPVVYVFSNGRKFRQKADPYSQNQFLLDHSDLDGPDVLA
jgi:hypothetical protein